MQKHVQYIKGTNLRVAAPGDLVECLIHTYHRIRRFAVLRVSQSCPSSRHDCDWSYSFEGMQGTFKGCNFRLVEDKFNPEFGGSSQHSTNAQQELKPMCNNERENESNVIPEIRIYIVQAGRIVHRILRNGHETAEECLARADDYIRTHPTAEAHVYRKIALRRTSPAPIENIEL